MKKIEVNGLSFSYPRLHGKDEKETLKDISFSAQESESIGLIGANGVGKSTLLKLLVGLQLEYTGEISLCGMKVCKENLAAVRQRTGYVFQDSDSQLFLATVYDDVAFGPRNFGLTKRETEERVTKALKAVHLEELRDRQIYRLSGGEKKLASIATILSTEPEIILLDEPSVALDPRNRRNLIQVLNGLTGVKIIASHDLDFIYDTCERTILVSEDGRIAADSRTKGILSDQELLEKNGLELPLSFSRM